MASPVDAVSAIQEEALREHVLMLWQLLAYCNVLSRRRNARNGRVGQQRRRCLLSKTIGLQ